MAQAFFGGVHPNDMKAATNEKAIEQLAPRLRWSFPCLCTSVRLASLSSRWATRLKLDRGSANPADSFPPPIHASISGTVKAVEPRPFSMGGKMMSVVIDNDFQDEVSEEVKPVADPDSLTLEQLVEIVKNAGIVGQGGATFPTHAKISSGSARSIRHHQRRGVRAVHHRRPSRLSGASEQIIEGAPCWPRCSAWQGVIGIEDNKQNAARRP